MAASIFKTRSHWSHDFIYPFGNDPWSVWFYAADIGLCYTGKGIYPWIYHATTADWYFYFEGSSPPKFQKATDGGIVGAEALQQ